MNDDGLPPAVQHKVDRPMRVLGYRTPAEPFADELPDLQA